MLPNLSVPAAILLGILSTIRNIQAAPFQLATRGNRASDELKGVTPAFGIIQRLGVHAFESLCRDRKDLAGGLAPSNCGLPYEALLSASNKPYCSGLLAGASIPGMICGACLEVTYKTKKTYVRYIDKSGGAFEISYTNYLEIAEPADYAQSSEADRSGVGTNVLWDATYQEVHGSNCDAYWDGRCSGDIVPGYPGANRPQGYSCVP